MSFTALKNASSLGFSGGDQSFSEAGASGNQNLKNISTLPSDYADTSNDFEIFTGKAKDLLLFRRLTNLHCTALYSANKFLNKHQIFALTHRTCVIRRKR